VYAVVTGLLSPGTYNPMATSDLTIAFNVILMVLGAILHVTLAMAVYPDAQSLALPDGRRGTFLVGPEIWAVGVLLGGLAAAAIYWVIHHSTLRPVINPPK